MAVVGGASLDISVVPVVSVGPALPPASEAAVAGGCAACFASGLQAAAPASSMAINTQRIDVEPGALLCAAWRMDVCDMFNSPR